MGCTCGDPERRETARKVALIVKGINTDYCTKEHVTSLTFANDPANVVAAVHLNKNVVEHLYDTYDMLERFD